MITATLHQTLRLELDLATDIVLLALLDDPAMQQRAQTGWTVAHREAYTALMQALREGTMQRG